MIILLIISLILILKFKQKSGVKKSKKYIIKNKRYIKSFVISNTIFFCCKNIEYEILNNISNALIIFNNEKLANNTLKVLSNAGFNLKLPIYKFEFYTTSFNSNCKVSNKGINFKNHNYKKNNVYNVNCESKTKLSDYNLNVLQKVYKTLQAINKLKLKNISANYLFFIDDETLFNPISKLIKHFNLLIKIYFKQDVDYALLGAINSLNINNNGGYIENNNITNFAFNKSNDDNNDLNKSKATVTSKNKNLNNKTLKNFNEFYSRLNTQSVLNFNEFNNFFLQVNSTNFNFSNFEFSGFYLASYLENNMFYSCLSLTQNSTINALVFKLIITNKTQHNIALNFSFLPPHIQKNAVNSVYLQHLTKTHIYLQNLITPKIAVFLMGNFQSISLQNGKITAHKKFNIAPKKTQEFYFLYTEISQTLMLNSKQEKLNIPNQKHLKNLLLNLPYYYQNNVYNKLKLTKVLTQNRTLNSLINNYLPQKIIKNYVLNNFYFCFKKTQNLQDYVNDFINLQNNYFNLDLVDNNFSLLNLNSFFLAKNNLYKIYLNLIYHSIGFFASNNGLIFNSNKTNLQTRAVVSLKHLSNNVLVNMSKVNLNNEIKIDNITYSNLNFFSITSKTKNLHLQF